MRKLIIFRLCVLSLISTSLLTFTTLTAAQTDPYADYLKELNTYFAARKTLESSQARYNSFKTVQSKQTVTGDAKKMLESGRSSLTQYTYFLGQNLAKTADTNSRVKTELLTDVQIHNGFLQSVANVLGETPTFTELNAQSQALTTRYGYLKITAQQTLLYMDAVRTYQNIIASKDHITTIKNLNKTLPDQTRQKILANEWIVEAESATATDEAAIVKLLEDIYPQAASTSTDPKRQFELQSSVASESMVAQVNSNLTTRTTKSLEILTLMEEGYRNL